MEKSILYDLLDRQLLSQWKEMIEKTESESWFFTNEKEVIKELETELNEKSKKLLTSYALAIENRIDYLYYNLSIKILNVGIKIGMELQKSFAENE